MVYQQLKAPNLSVIGQPEMCLAYVREVFGIGPKYATAALGWSGAQFKHPGEQPPTDVAVPVWFSWKNDGHVAVSVPGKGIYSTSARGDKVFTNIEALLNFMGEGMAYLGWSEDVNGGRVVEPAPAPTAEYVNLNPNVNVWHLYPLGVEPVLKNALGKTLDPAKFGGLSYTSHGNPYPNTHTIKTADFGTVNIYIDKDGSVTDKPLYRLVN